MVRIEYVNANDKKAIEEVVNIHIRAFKDFFLSTMSSSFIRKMYHSYCVHEGSELMVTYEEDKAVGFLAYSTDMSGLYKYMLTRHFFFFAWYAFRAFIKRPSSFLKLFSALRKPSEAKRAHNYVKLSSKYNID